MLEWRALDGIPTISVLYLGTDQVARVDKRQHSNLWSSDVNRHLRDARRHLSIVVPSERLAKRFAERWVRANLQRILSELPTSERGLGCRRMVWPASNPPDPRWPT